MHFSGLEKSRNLWKMAMVMEKSFYFNFFHELWFLVNKVLIEFEKMQGLKINYTMNLHYIKK